MKEVYFKQIMIADLQNKTARVQPFEKGLNVVTSIDNHVGKSSLLKSLYYTLGAKVDFDSVWDRQSKLYVVTLSVDETEYCIARFMKRFAVFKGKTLLKITDSVTQELAPLLFSISLFICQIKILEKLKWHRQLLLLCHIISIKIRVGVDYMTALLQLLNTRVRIELNHYIIISTFIPKGQSNLWLRKIVSRIIWKF